MLIQPVSSEECHEGKNFLSGFIEHLRCLQDAWFQLLYKAPMPLSHLLGSLLREGQPVHGGYNILNRLGHLGQQVAGKIRSVALSVGTRQLDGDGGLKRQIVVRDRQTNATDPRGTGHPKLKKRLPGHLIFAGKHIQAQNLPVSLALTPLRSPPPHDWPLTSCALLIHFSVHGCANYIEMALAESEESSCPITQDRCLSNPVKIMKRRR